METVVFFALAVVAIASALLLVLFRNPVYSALSLLTTLLCVAGLFVLLQAHFLAAAQVIVYAGAVMVLFLFVIMLLNLGASETIEAVSGRYRGFAILLLSTMLLAFLGLTSLRQIGGQPVPNRELAADNTTYVGKLLYTDFLFPFELTSMVLLVALIGAVVLLKRESVEESSQP